jgi:hypothetical protein
MRSTSRKKRNKKSIGDEDLDNEGEIVEKTPRQMKEIEKIPTGPPPPAISSTGVPLDPSKTVVGRYVIPKRHKKHYMQTKTWVSVAKKSTPLNAVDEGSKKMTKCLNLEHVHGFSAQQARNNLMCKFINFCNWWFSKSTNQSLNSYMFVL